MLCGIGLWDGWGLLAWAAFFPPLQSGSVGCKGGAGWSSGLANPCSVAGKRGRRNSVGSLDSTIEVSGLKEEEEEEREPEIEGGEGHRWSFPKPSHSLPCSLSVLSFSLSFTFTSTLSRGRHRGLRDVGSHFFGAEELADSSQSELLLVKANPSSGRQKSMAIFEYQVLAP